MDVNNEWITDRPPTFEDADEEGDVYIRYTSSDPSCRSAVAWCDVMVGAHWKHTEIWKEPSFFSNDEEWITDRAPTEEDADGEGCIISMNEDWGTPQYSPWDKVWKQPPWKHSPRWSPNPNQK